MTRREASGFDAQYNNRARMPEHLQIFERWRRGSVTARAMPNCAPTVALCPPVAGADHFTVLDDLAMAGGQLNSLALRLLDL